MRSRLKRARVQIEVLRLALAGPSPWEIAAALPGLEEAARILATVEPDPEIRGELLLLKRDLRISARLIEQGLEFCGGLSRILGAGPAYAPTGQSVPIRSAGTLSLQG